METQQPNGDAGGADGEKKKFFGGGEVPRFLRSFNNTSGQINPAYEQIEDDTDDDQLSENEHTISSLSNRSTQNSVPYDEVNVLNEGKDFKVNFKDLNAEGEPPTFYTERKSEDKTKTKRNWDRFTTSSSDNISTTDIKFWENVSVILKIVTIVILFIVTLGTSVIAKICFIVITANIFPQANNDSALKTVNHTLILRNKYAINVQWIWALMVMVIAPYIFTALRCLWRLFFQQSHRGSPLLSTIAWVLFIETIHTIGLNLMMFFIIPELDPISGLLFTLCIGVIPGILKICYPRIKHEEGQTYATKITTTCVSILGTLGQILAIGTWCYHLYVNFNETFKSKLYVAFLIIAPILTSAHWWENYVLEGKKDASFGLPALARRIRKSRTKLVFYASVWKTAVTIVFATAFYGINCETSGKDCLRVLYFLNNNTSLSSGIGHFEMTSVKYFKNCSAFLPLIVAAVGVLSSGVCFKAAKFGCKIMTQIADYSLPLVLSTPASFGVILAMYSGFLTSPDENGCQLPFPTWKDDNNARIYFADFLKDINWTQIAAGLIGFISFLLVTNHVWMPGKERLQRTDKIFVQPLYCGIFFDQSLLLNRRRVEKTKISDTVKSKVSKIPLPEVLDETGFKESPFRTSDTPMIYMCGTMWHETENEMTQLLKSLFRMDEDQCTRKHAQFLCGRRDPDYYEFEAHIFFDDAFEPHRDDEYDYTVNTYVKLLLKSVKVSACSMYGMDFKIPDPTKIATPYGGQLVWKLPGNNKLIAHLKDKSLIRHRKRWSQVMYMYYFLGHQLLQQKLSRKKLQKKADNTYILALDGDVDFHPSAVQLLVDRMKKNPNVGAACGRIHPIGNGAMVWYQKFEYAVSHWLQKAAEDKFGCVLCSPGCFSLFRGSSLMDENVMNKYTTSPSEARHYVQYDQGEDRWLCTLLLQQGHRVEYCAASDALTFAPEGFYEFFNQRRRWTPSTLANIIDLLTDWKNVIKKNPEITIAYIFYQALLIVSSILTPGTIFLMILGAINLAFPKIDLWVALLVNALPVAIMVLLCFKAKTETQLTFAAVLSTFYSLLMMIVIVGLLRQAGQSGLCSVTTMFLLFVAGVFIICAFLHPQEFWCIIHGFLYFLAIPSMSMLLMLFSLGNLHNVTWGTRETKAAGDPNDQNTQKKTKLSGLFAIFNQCLPVSSTQKEDDRLRMVLDRLDGIENNIRSLSAAGSSRMSVADSMSPRPRTPVMIGDNEPGIRFSNLAQVFEGTGQRENPTFEDKQLKRDIMVNPYWMQEDHDIKRFNEDKIDDNEINFWKELIEEYLKPLVEDKKKKEEIQAELIELRNKVCLIFILINSLFIIIIFSIQQVISTDKGLAIHLWCAQKDKNNEYPKETNIEPISVAFTVVFGVLLLVQFICMLMHRMATLLHVLAATEIFKKKRKLNVHAVDTEEDVEESDASQNMIMNYNEVYELVRDMQKIQDDDTASITSESSYSPSEADDDEETANKKKEKAKSRWKQLARRRMENRSTLADNFNKNFVRLQTVIKERNVEDNVDNEDDEKIQREIRTNAKFGKMRSKSIHTAAALYKNSKFRDQISKKKVIAISRWRVATENVISTNLQNNQDNPDGRRNIFKHIVQAVKAKKNIEEAKDDSEPEIPLPDSPVAASIDVSPDITIHSNNTDSLCINADEDHHKNDHLNQIVKEFIPKNVQYEEIYDDVALNLEIPKVENDYWPEDNENVQL